MKLMLGKPDDTELTLAEHVSGAWRPNPNLAADMATFLKGADQAATDENPATHGPALPIVVSGWATNMAQGPATATDEAGQQLSFVVTNNDNVVLFTPAGQPAIDPTGKLTFTPAPNAHGTAQITVNCAAAPVAPAAAPVAVAPVAPQIPSQLVISPPNTGDGGLKAQD